MKIRIGFVSNSSSASYIVKIKGVNLETIVNKFDGYSIYSFITELKERIVEFGKYRLENVATCPEVRKFREEQDKRDKELLLKLDKALESDSQLDKMKVAMDAHGVSYVEDGGDLTLNYFTSMHNDYNDGMCGLLKEILMTVMFETDFKVECEIENDG